MNIKGGIKELSVMVPQKPVVLKLVLNLIFF